ncbi:type II toxin-antitoxin system VapC family toxin [Bradyrhizobium sp.]|uniref:type II toxin-antitoxin system VapC family toxin n=1 Tax=Bradyrhizobium sp. TaxID=376 RepID=UPI0023A0FCFB|nr:type II toxin-antitoxin system VapC family toxin [Bradyrhizobium sp.]MDE2376333.1 type II toxin-antitoxin system VapC family toxin [Bradyrhizobium sp.]
MYLVDTNVLSAASPNRPAPSALVEWMDAHSASLFISVVTIAEVEDGIAKLQRERAARRSRDLAQWLEAVLHLYGDRVLVVDAPIARIAGRLSDRARGQGHAPGFADIIIAATAHQHGLTILSRNASHFAPLGIAVHDPDRALPPS